MNNREKYALNSVFYISFCFTIMIFLFLFIKIFFLPIYGSLQCTGGPDCRITLNFTQIVPTNNKLRETCSIINASSCFVHVEVNYNHQKVDISFKEVSEGKILSDYNNPNISL
jgi:hypothetical protein